MAMCSGSKCNWNYPQVARDGGFKLRKYKDGPIDWRLMGSYETDRIMREQNIEQLEQALSHLSEAPLGSVLDTNILDSGIAKYFIMSQFAIQYLIYCRKFLDETLCELREAHASAHMELAQLRKSHMESNNEIVKLTKKITEIETIREVVYPCHLCTKNFISNEALNIHIGRKHSGRSGVSGTMATAASIETSPYGQGHVKETKDTDMSLINTIKMELEIKQLKERLNAAERNIRERSSNTSSHKAPTRMPAKEVRHIGIQNDLMEPKEKDEVSEMLESESSEQKEHLHELEARISSFETWQERLKYSNEQFIDEINKKLEDITITLNSRREERRSLPENLATPRLAELERMLTEKVNEIGKASTAKLEEVVQHMELGYKDKLETMERELKRLGKSKESQTPVEVVQHFNQSQRDTEQMQAMRRQVDTAVKAKYNYAEEDDVNETYSLEDVQQTQKKPPAGTSKLTLAGDIHMQSSDSNHTYIKSDDELPATKLPIKNVLPKPKVMAESPPEITDISESLNDEESMSEEDMSELHEEKSALPTARLAKGQPRVPKPKLYTRNDARKLVNKRLTTQGLDLHVKHVSTTMMKRIKNGLAVERSVIKLKKPHFYATRNRIKNFVDKLCSAKLSDGADTILKHKKPLQPAQTPRQPVPSITSDDEEVADLSRTSSDSNEAEPVKNQEFKQRLERLLSIPAANTTSSAVVQVHSQISATSGGDNRPVPLPRKRVMFNTLNSDTVFDGSGNESH